MKVGIIVASLVFLVSVWCLVTIRPRRDGATTFQAPSFKKADEPESVGVNSRTIADVTRVDKTEHPGNQIALRSVMNAIRKENETNDTDDIMVIMVSKSAKLQFGWLFDENEPFVVNRCHGSPYPQKKCAYVHGDRFYNISDLVVHNMFYSGAKFPSWRPSGQKWVAFDIEAPPQSLSWTKKDMSPETRAAFNISSFFSLDSPVPYGKNSKYAINWDKYYKLKRECPDFTANKTRTAVWLSSHCKTQSERERYVQELKKYVDVDIFGTCGNKMCTDRSNRMQSCEVDLLSKYHFYLSFENCLCENYITEKLYKVYSGSVRIVPIVMGLAEYSEFLPHTTYLDVRDFASPKDLASRMKEIKMNKETYNEFIVRKMAAEKQPEPGYACLLCDHAYKHRDKTERIDDVIAMWSVEKRCRDPREVMPGQFWDAEKNKRS